MQSSDKIFSKPITDIIKERISIRSYKPQPLDDSLRTQLNNFINELSGPFSAKVRFILVDSDKLQKDNIKLGTYGVISGASTFIISAVDNGDMNFEELGYEFEKLVLFAQSIGLGTCWLGGTFKKGEFAKAIQLKEDEILPTVSPIGYQSESKKILSSFIRFAAGSKNRKNWEEMFFNGNFNTKLSNEEAGEYLLPLEMTRLSPSASNKQPWRIVKDGNNYHFYLSHTKGYAKALGFDMQRIDIGIAMCHFELTSKELGLNGKWMKTKPSIKAQEENIEYIISWVK